MWLVSTDEIYNLKENKLRYLVELLNSTSVTMALPDHQNLFNDGYVVLLLQNVQPKRVM